MEGSSESPKFKILYEETLVRYSRNVMLQCTDQDITFEFSGGLIRDPDTQQPVMPIHTRIAMTPEAAHRLLQVLSRTLEGMNQAPAMPASAAEISAPKMRTAHKKGETGGFPKL